MSSKKIWVSEIEYRADPADSKKDVIHLGLLVEFTTPEYWAIGYAIRAGLDKSKLAGLDDLSRTLLEHRGDVITRELDQILSKVKKPGDALGFLAAANPWSIHVSHPRLLDVPASVVRNVATPDQMVLKFIGFYIQRLQRAAQKASTKKSTARPRPSQTPPRKPSRTWICSPKTVFLEMRA